MNIREKQSVTSTDPVISSSAGRLDKIPLLGLQTNNKYPLNIMHKYNVHVTANFQILEIKVVSIQVVLIQTQAVKLHKNVVHLRYSL